MCTERAVLEHYLASINRSSAIAEFPFYLHRYTTGRAAKVFCPHQPLLYLLLPHLCYPAPFLPNMATSLKGLIPSFPGWDVSDEGAQADPTEFIENPNFAIDGETYTDENRKLTATRVIFRTLLRDKALLWYHCLNTETRASWQLLEAAFLSGFVLVARKEVDQTRFLNLVFNFKQRRRSIVEYTSEGDCFNAGGPEKFRDKLGHQFIARPDDKRKTDLVQVYLGANKSTVSYADAKQAVKKAYQRFGEPSPFDHLYDKPSSPPPTSTLTLKKMP